MSNRLEQPAAPLMVSLCAQSTFSQIIYHLYSLTDTFFVANGVGSLASGAVGIVSPMMALVNGISSTLGTGSASMISRRLGAGHSSQSKAVVGCMMFVWLVSALIVTTAGLAFLHPLLSLLGCPPEIYPYARDYARIILLSTVVSTGFSSIMRAQGDIGYSTIQWSVPVMINLILDPVLIYGLQLGITGAALATGIAQIFSAVNSVYYFFFRKATLCRVEIWQIRWDSRIFKEMVSIGLPSFLGSLSASMATALGNQVLGVTGGAAAIGAFSIVNRIQSFASTPFSGIMQGIQPMLGFDQGRGNQSRIQHVMRLAFLSVLAYGCVAAICVRLRADQLMGLFAKDPRTFSVGTSCLEILCWALVPGGVLPVMQAYLQALGYGRQVLWLSLGSVFLIRMPLLAVAGWSGSLAAVWWTLAITPWLIALWAIFQYGKERKRL